MSLNALYTNHFLISSVNWNLLLTNNVHFGDCHVMKTNFPSCKENENERETRHIIIAFSRWLDMGRYPSGILFRTSDICNE